MRQGHRGAGRGTGPGGSLLDTEPLGEDEQLGGGARGTKFVAVDFPIFPWNILGISGLSHFFCCVQRFEKENTDYAIVTAFCAEQWSDLNSFILQYWQAIHQGNPPWS